jgi:acetyltransferase-like isoleucine patch superfamily enzyme
MSRIARYVWLDFVSTLTSCLPDLVPIMRMRGFLARLAFKRCGRDLQIARHVCIVRPDNLEIGHSVYLAYGVWMIAAGGITLEDEVMLGPYAVIASGDHTRRNGSFRHGEPKRAPVRIRKGAWIGAHAVVTKGVTIGEGAVLGANAVCTKDVPPFAVAAGAPARILKEDPAPGGAAAS